MEGGRGDNNCSGHNCGKMAFYANVDADAAGFSPKTGFFLDVFALRPMSEATFPQLRPSIRRPEGDWRGSGGLPPVAPGGGAKRGGGGTA